MINKITFLSLLLLPFLCFSQVISFECNDDIVVVDFSDVANDINFYIDWNNDNTVDESDYLLYLYELYDCEDWGDDEDNDWGDDEDNDWGDDEDNDWGDDEDNDWGDDEDNDWGDDEDNDWGDDEDNDWGDDEDNDWGDDEDNDWGDNLNDGEEIIIELTTMNDSDYEDKSQI